MRTSAPTITDLPASPGEDTRARTRQYVVMMGIRVICMIVAIVFAVVAPGWWLVIPILGAVFLPFVAVVVANAPRASRSRIVRPGPKGLGPRSDAEDGDARLR